MTSNHARSRADGRQQETVIDERTGRKRIVVRSRTGRIIDKNRSSHRGYKSTLTDRQRKLIRWALRQLDNGHKVYEIWWYLENHWGWESGPFQYPLVQETIFGWNTKRANMKRNGKVWP